MLFHSQTTYGSDRFRQIFIDHWHRWLDLHEEDIPADQRAYVRKTIQKMLGCRNPQSGYARYVCPGCGEERIVPFSCKTRFCPSPSTERTGSVCGKVRTDQWVNRISTELLETFSWGWFYKSTVLVSQTVPNKSMHANCYRPFLQQLRAGKEMGNCGDHRQPAIA